MPGTVYVLSHPDCLNHETSMCGEIHQEGPDRVTEIHAALLLLSDGIRSKLTFLDDFPLCSIEAASRVHLKEYVDFLSELSARMSRRRSTEPIPLTPQIVHRFFRDDMQLVASSTRFSKYSFRAAMRAAGAVCHAVDCVAKSQGGAGTAAFCLVRPPGHHAGQRAYVKCAEGCGFCLINHVAVGAAHAIKTHGMRVAIIDWDCHHGNGTEELVQRAECWDTGDAAKNENDFKTHKNGNEHDTGSVSTGSKRRNTNTGTDVRRWFGGTNTDGDADTDADADAVESSASASASATPTNESSKDVLFCSLHLFEQKQQPQAAAAAASEANADGK